MRNISFAITTPQVMARTKTVTRRMGWRFAKPGMVVRAVEKGMGLKKGEKVKTLGTIRFTDVRFERLEKMSEDQAYGQAEVVKEGFPEMTPDEFVAMWCDLAKCQPDIYVTRIEFEYVGS